LLPNIGFPELILILVIIVVILGPGKLPELGKAIGKTVRAYRKEAYDGLPPPLSRRERRRLEQERAQAEAGAQAPAAATHAAPPAGDQTVADPNRRGIFTGVLRVLQFLFRLWRWRKRLP
jgi:TatA/E family protein of Tat protein translocase